MNTLYYTVDIKNLLNIQEDETEKNNKEKEIERLKGIENKKELLKIILPLAHGIMSLHNNKCNIDMSSTTGVNGLLGLRKIKIQKQLDYIINTDSNYVWTDNYQHFTFNEGASVIKLSVWLNKKPNAHIHTNNLNYSMTLPKILKGVYGKSVENTLEQIAKYCSKYTDQWN